MQAIQTLRPFIGPSQLYVVAENCGGEERQYFYDKLVELAGTVESMPKTYEQDGKGDDAVAYLHYFIGNCDWWIIEKDAGSPDDPPGTGQLQAFGFTNLGDPQNAELGYISIVEVLEVGAELDFHFQPTPIREIKRNLGLPFDEANSSIIAQP